MMPPPSSELHARLIAIASDSAWFMSALRAARQLQLSSWCIGAGAVRNLVWDALHELPTPTQLPDIDLAYFDAACLTPERDAQLQQSLAEIMSGVPWEVTNQAGVHHWFEDYFGHPVPALHSLEEAVASWPEYATSVGLRLEHDDTISVIAPHGLDDLFAMVIRRNPSRASIDTYRQRVAQKRYAERWPRVVVVDLPFYSDSGTVS